MHARLESPPLKNVLIILLGDMNTNDSEKMWKLSIYRSYTSHNMRSQQLFHLWLTNSTSKWTLASAMQARQGCWYFYLCQQEYITLRQRSVAIQFPVNLNSIQYSIQFPVNLTTNLKIPM